VTSLPHTPKVYPTPTVPNTVILPWRLPKVKDPLLFYAYSRAELQAEAAEMPRKKEN
jgi:hypothetical protein